MYEAPVDDYKFVLDDVIGLDKLMSATGHDEISIDLVEAVLSEAGKLAADVIAPLNHLGDQTGATRHDDASVTTPDGFAMPMRQWLKAAGPRWKRAKHLAGSSCRWF